MTKTNKNLVSLAKAAAYYNSLPLRRRATLVSLAKSAAHYNSLIAAGAPKPSGSSPLWNAWAANNPTGPAMALATANTAGMLKTSLLNPRGLLGSGARPVEA